MATFNPSLLAAVTAMLLLPRPQRLMLGYLAGAYTTSIVAGLVIVFALHQSAVVKTSKRTISPGVDIVVGIIALAIAFGLIAGVDAQLHRWRQRRRAAGSGRRPAKPSWQDRMLGKGSAGLTFLVGVLVSFPGVSYLNALHHIVVLGPSTAVVVALILYFCLMQQILLELPLLASLFAEEGTQRVVIHGKAWLGHHGRRIGELALTGIGIFLIIRGLASIS
ncbi:MAG: GAP family protein [Solirubrobacterales bacterium]|nr:GAP family protein [Solirubrobacterales bacterium]